MLRFPKLTALLLAVVIPAIPALSVAVSGCPQAASGMSCCPRMPLQAEMESSIQTELEHQLSADRSCCHDVGAASPTPAQSLTAPVSAITVHLPPPAAVALVPVVAEERGRAGPLQPDVGVSPQAILCTFLI